MTERLKRAVRELGGDHAASVQPGQVWYLDTPWERASEPICEYEGRLKPPVKLMPGQYRVTSVMGYPNGWVVRLYAMWYGDNSCFFNMVPEEILLHPDWTLIAESKLKGERCEVRLSDA